MTAPLEPETIPESPDELPASADPTEGEPQEHTHWEPEPEPGEELPEPTEGIIAPEGEPEPLPDADLTPVTVRVGREQVPIEGAIMAPEGLYVPKEAVGRVLEVLQRGTYFERTKDDVIEQRRAWGQAVERERAESTRQTALREVLEAEAGAYTKELEQIFKDEDSFLAFAENYGHNIELLKARVAMAKNTAVMEVMKRGIDLDKPANVVPVAETQKQAAAALIENFDDIVSSTELATLIPDVKDQDAVFQMLLKNPRRYIEPAPYDIPEAEIRKGELVINRENLFNDAKQFAAFRAQAPATTRADKVNKAVLAAPRRPAPSPRAPRAPGSEKPAMTEREWRRRLMQMARES